MEKKNGSRLLQMQAMFQQKQLQEREMKIASLYEAQQARALERVRLSPGNDVTPTSTSPSRSTVTHHTTQPGKVRQMFEERRMKGIDKSYPLQPIQNTERPAPRKTLPNGYTKVSSTASRTTVENKTTRTHGTNINRTHSIKRQHQLQKTEKINGSGDLNHNHVEDINSNTKLELPQSNGEMISNMHEVDKVDSDEPLANESFPKSPKRVEPKKPPARRNNNPSQAPKPAAKQEATQKIINNTPPENNKAQGAMQRGANPATQPPSQSSVGSKGVARSARGATSAASAGGGGGSSSAGGVACPVCDRHFAQDRIDKHKEICAKSHAKKRKPFDALKHRLAGTEAEPFIGKLRKGNTSSTKIVKNKPLNNNWRQKHEEFIQAIRAAKEVQAHLNAGGKLSDLPPPPPSENPDYVKCPHCNRRFNQGAAERHIPKCANYQFNKKPAPTKRR